MIDTLPEHDLGTYLHRANHILGSHPHCHVADLGTAREVG